VTGKEIVYFINYPLTISCTSGWKHFTTSWLGGVFVSAQNKRMNNNGRIRNYDHCIFIPVYPPRWDFFPFLSYIYKEHKIASCGKDRYCWLNYYIKIDINENFTKVEVLINKSSYFIIKFVNSLEKHNFADSEVSYINFINSVWRGSFTFEMAQCLSLACYSNFAHCYLLGVFG
jgi:hypothetical protein